MKTADIQWDEKGLPCSVLFEDKYFCEQDGLLESEYVFCGGNHLAERFKALNRTPHRECDVVLPVWCPVEDSVFTIIETGFGTGLNFLCVWTLWNECAPKNWKLHYVSLDQYPLSSKDLNRSLELWPSLIECKNILCDSYVDFDKACNEAEFNEGSVKLTVIFDDVLSALDSLINQNIQAEAFFLDGFAPSKNPQMWSADVFKRLEKLSQEQTTLATFTVAGTVVRGLKEVGFEVAKVKGFGRKRHMLIGHRSGSVCTENMDRGTARRARTV